MATLRNDKNGETVITRMTNEEAAAEYARRYGRNDNHWMWFWVHTMVNRDMDREAARAAPGARMVTTFVADSFVLAVGYGLRRPMIRVHFKSRRYKIYLSPRGTLCLKSGYVVMKTDPKTGEVRPTVDPERDEEFVGFWGRGEFVPARLGDWSAPRHTRPLRPMSEDEKEFVRNINERPVQFLAERGKDMSRCCYCDSPLEDERSKAVGYGPVCADHWGLPWGNGTGDKRVPSFAERHDIHIAGLCNAIREKPTEPMLWAILGDRLEELGLPPITFGVKPKDRITDPGDTTPRLPNGCPIPRRVVLPRND